LESHRIETVVLKYLTALSLAVPHFAAVAAVAAVAGRAEITIPERHAATSVKAKADQITFTLNVITSG
jgi:hypothetical protein